MPLVSIDCLDRHSLGCFRKYGLTALTKIKKIDPPAPSQRGGVESSLLKKKVGVAGVKDRGVMYR